MPRYRLPHLRGPYEDLVSFKDFDADSDEEAIAIANRKRQMFAMQLEKIGSGVIGKWPASRPDL